MLHQVDARRHVVGYRIELLGRTSDEEIALLGSGYLRLDLRRIGEGHVHSAARLRLEGISNFLERIGHTSAAIYIELVAFEHFRLSLRLSSFLRFLRRTARTTRQYAARKRRAQCKRAGDCKTAPRHPISPNHRKPPFAQADDYRNPIRRSVLIYPVMRIIQAIVLAWQ